MFRNSLNFRKKLDVDNLLQNYAPSEVITKYLTGGFCGHDKEYSRIRVELFGKLDIKGLMYSARKVEFEKAKLHQCETTVEDWKNMSKKLGRRIDGSSVIFDMQGVGTEMLWKPGLDMYLHTVKVLEDNYPEMLKRMFVINAPRIFPLMWKICRPLISEDMKKKIFVLGGDYKDVMLQYIDADQLPKMYGGTLTDPDGNPQCETMICQGGKVPKSYYLKELSLSSHLKTASLKAGDKVELEYNVDKKDCVLRWEFKTEDYDVGFGLSLKTSSGEKKKLLPVERVNCHIIPEDGSWNCEELGTYVLIFDNSFSWARGKKIDYMVEVFTDVMDETTEAEMNERSAGGDWKKLAENLESTHIS